MATPTPPHRWPVPVGETWTWTPPVGAGIGPDHELSLEISWCEEPSTSAPLTSAAPLAVVLIHGFGACKEHWRHTLPSLGAHLPTYALDLVGFGNSSQPRARLADEQSDHHSLHYGFELWGAQVAAFCREIVGRPVLLVGNSIGGVVALRATQLLNADAGPSPCSGLVLIDCAQRLMDDKQLGRQPAWMAWIRPLLKAMVRQRWLSTALFRNAARPALIRQVLRQAYPSGAHVDEELVDLLYRPSRRPGAAEAFRGFINLFNDHLAPDLLAQLDLPVHLIWGEADPWEPVTEARAWAGRFPCIRSLQILPGVGHCPHDEAPELVNPLLLAIAEQTSRPQQMPDQRAPDQQAT
ncbi:alpha/beta fold hydrolase [Synechococcus sp. WH 8101]|uniref:alpha/beta fold hydrolase n=1 Tax=Synechococcus sp. WH 8101 TaxID=59932 RepID=UPI0020C1F6E5|nr:alpha/beta fold hydrolase [Synechococcus sp. WH 8101]